MSTPPHADQLGRIRHRVDQRLGELAERYCGSDPGLSDAIRGALLSGGKRLRPVLTVVTCEDLGGPAGPALDAGCAAEMVHAASLILDDLPCMDDAATRRGVPTVHRKHGEDTAILAAIALLSAAFSTLGSLRGADANTRSELTRIMADAVGTGGLVTGQFRDLRSGRSGPEQDPATVNALKTGSLISACVAMGGAIARADAARRRQLAEFAAHLGQAFQLFDDLLDQKGTALSTGKDVGKDVGKLTVMRRDGAEAAERRLSLHLDAAHATLETLFGSNCRMASAVDSVFVAIPQFARFGIRQAEA